MRKLCKVALEGNLKEKSKGYETKFLENVKILGNSYVGGGNYLMTVISRNTADGILKPEAGQFYMIQLKNGIRLLRRPISLHSADLTTGKLEFLYKVLGKGTEELSYFSEGDIINIQGPLGKGFEIVKNSKKAVVVGGGIGLAPLKQLIGELLSEKGNENIVLIAGGRDSGTIKILDNFDLSDKRLQTLICTDDGSAGEKGNVIEVLKRYIEFNKDIDMLYSCGPDKVLELINDIANENSIQSQVSMEERMACGVGACVGCSIKTDKGMKKVCHEGPVFYSEIFRRKEGEK